MQAETKKAGAAAGDLPGLLARLEAALLTFGSGHAGRIEALEGRADKGDERLEKAALEAGDARRRIYATLDGLKASQAAHDAAERLELAEVKTSVAVLAVSTAGLQKNFEAITGRVWWIVGGGFTGLVLVIGWLVSMLFKAAS